MRKITLLFAFILSIYEIHAQGVLLFNYDNAGNQNQRFYCADPNNCNIPNPPAGKAENEPVSENDATNLLENKFSIYPNPTDGAVSIKWDISVKDLIQKIEIVGYHTPYYKEVSFRNAELATYIDLSKEIPSVYIVHFILKDQVITKKIIKI